MKVSILSHVRDSVQIFCIFQGNQREESLFVKDNLWLQRAEAQGFLIFINEHVLSVFRNKIWNVGMLLSFQLGAIQYFLIRLVQKII